MLAGRAQPPRAHLRERSSCSPSEVIPQFAERARAARAGEGRAAGAGDRARAGPPRAAPAQAPPATRSTSRPSSSARRAAGAAELRRGGRLARRRRRSERGGQEGSRLVRGASDAAARAPFRQRLAQRAIFTGHGAPVRAQVRLRLRGRHRLRAQPHHGNGKRALDRWTVRVRRRRGDARCPAQRRLTGRHLQAERADFARLAAEEVDPQELLFGGRFDIEGDLSSQRACRRCSAGRRSSSQRALGPRFVHIPRQPGAERAPARDAPAPARPAGRPDLDGTAQAQRSPVWAPARPAAV